MSDLVIRAEKVGKRYKLGLKAERHKTFRDTLAGMMKSPLRNLRELSEKTREEETFWALRDVNFEVRRGEVLGIIGRNGAGKSTLLKILSRITEPTEGRVGMRGRVASLLEVGTGFHPELTGRENILFNGSILGMRQSEVKKKFDEIVAFAEVEKFLDTPVKRYSSGMYVRLAFAVAAHLEPEILIVDEVLAVGDSEFQRKCIGKMQEVSTGEGRTVLFVSHNMAAVQKLCTRGILLRAGRVEADGPVDHVLETYLSHLATTAADAFGDNPERNGTGAMRFTSARILDERGRETRTLVAGREVTMEFGYRNDGDLRKVVVYMTVYNAMGVPVTHFASDLNTFDPGPLGQQGVFTVKVPRLPLPVGSYRVAISVWDAGRGSDKPADAMPNVMVFDVESSIFFTSHRSPPGQYCCVMVDHEWGHESGRNDLAAEAAENTEKIESQKV